MADPISATVAFAVSAWTSAVTATAGALATIGTVGAIGEGATIALAGGILKTGAMLSLSAASAALLRPKTPASGTTLDFKPDPKAPVRGAMGYTALGGNKVFQATWGYNRVAMSLGVALSLGPIDQIQQFRADDAVVTFSGAQQEATGFYAADMWQRTTLGLPTDAALLPPAGLKYGNPGLTGWGTQNAAPGTAFAFWTMVLAKNPQDRDIFTNGVPDPRWIGRWMKVWQPRYDSTYPGGSGPQRRDDWRTWGWSENPYDHALAWVRGHYKMNADGSLDRTKRIAGIGAPDAAIDIPAFVEGMNVADANGWTISGEWSTSDGKFQTLIAMLQAGGGEPISRGAQISVMVNAPRVATYTYTRDDLIGSAEIRPLTPRRERKNTITPRYRSEANGWEYVPAGEVTSQVYRDEDRGEPRSLEIEYVHVRDARQAGQLAAYDLANLREGLTATLPSKAHLMHIHPGDCIMVDVPELALAGQKFVVRRVTASHQSASVTLEMRSESDGKHAWALGQAAQPAPSPSLSAVDPKVIAAPRAEDWSAAPKPASGGVSQPVIVLQGEVGTTDVSTLLIEHSTSAGGPWTLAFSGAPLTDGKYDVPGLSPQTAYWFSIRHVARNGAISDRLVIGPYTAPGLTSGGTTVPTDGANRVYLSNFERNIWGWGVRANPLGLGISLGANIFGGRRFLRAETTFFGTDQIFSLASTKPFPVRSGERLSVQFGGQTLGVARIDAYALFFDTNGTQLPSQPIGNIPRGSSVLPTPAQAFITAPAGAVTGLLEFYVIPDGSAGYGAGTITQPMVSGANAGQTQHPPYSVGPIDLTDQVQWIDDAGRIRDGRGLPINAAAGAAIVVNPPRPFGPGSPPDTTITMTVATVTLVGGFQFTLPSSTIPGLAPNTTYGVFRDLVAGTYVALSTGASALFVSPDRYLFLGYQKTAQDAGGSYSPPPEPPPGGGGGIGANDPGLDPGGGGIT